MHWRGHGQLGNGVDEEPWDEEGERIDDAACVLPQMARGRRVRMETMISSQMKCG